jgi:glycosyltransferase involved in cell wall biosynthesis
MTGKPSVLFSSNSGSPFVTKQASSNSFVVSKVSIIIPAYKQAQFLAQAIESSLGQTWSDLEVLVIDDGSPDQTPTIAQRYLAHPSFKYIRQENAGLPRSRNRGITESTGDYLCFLDSDDYFGPTKVARQAALLDADPALGFVYCDVSNVDENGVLLAEQSPIADVPRELSGNIFASLIVGGYFPPHSVMVRRSVLEQVGPFDPSLGGHADYELWLRISGAGFRAAFVPEALAFYRIHGGSMSRDGLHMAETRIATLDKISKIYPGQVAAGVNQLQQLNQDLFLGNQWLKNNSSSSFDRDIESAESGRSRLSNYRLVRHLKEAKRTKGKSDQVALWDANIDGTISRAIFLHPEAEISFTLPTSVRGTFTTAVAIHQDAWDKPNAGGCEFLLKVDGRIGLVISLDPSCRVSDRHWHEIKIDVPASSTGHQLTLETRPFARAPICAWALWREPVFTWENVHLAGEAPAGIPIGLSAHNRAAAMP